MYSQFYIHNYLFTAFTESGIADNSTESEGFSNAEENIYFETDSEFGETSSSEYSSESEDDEFQDSFFVDNADKPLYAGSPINVAEQILSLLSLLLRFNMSGVLFSKILSLIVLHCPKPNFCVKTIYKFKKILKNIDTPIIKLYYCSICFNKQDSNSEECKNCNTKTAISYFMEIPLIEQLENFYKRPGFKEMLNHRFTRVKIAEDNYEDIYDGSIYRELVDDGFMSNQNNITLTWNMDGVPLYKSSKLSIWPFFLVINELPYSQRFKRENMILAGLWFGKTKPAVNIFLNSFRKSLKKLCRGISVNIPNSNDLLQVKGIVICRTCDLVAKCHFLNMKQFNGDYGCQNCNEKGLTIDHVYVYPYSNEIEMRTTSETLKFAEDTLKLNKDVFGVKGPSELSKITQPHKKKKNVKTHGTDHIYLIFLRSLIPNPWSI